MLRVLIGNLITALAVSAAGCDPCTGEGKNGVADPGPNEFQLVFNNIVSADSDLFVNDQQVCTVCMQTEFITVGNYPVSTQTTIKIHSNVSNSDCYDSARCTANCDAQTCVGLPYLDTTPFAGHIMNTGLVWQQ